MQTGRKIDRRNSGPYLRNRSRHQNNKAVGRNKMTRRLFTMAAACALVAGFALGFVGQAPAQDYPTQTIKLVIPFGPGGGSDIVGRIIAQRMQEKLGQPVVIENK